MDRKLNINYVSNNLAEAIQCRDTRGFRFDNTDYWENYYRNKNKSKDFNREKRYAKFLREQVEKGGVWLDVATGYGFLPLELQKLGVMVECVDKFPSMILLAREYFKKNGFDLKIEVADIVQMPFKDKSFSAISAMSTLEHFPLLELKTDVLPEMKRVLKDEGLLFVHMPIKSMVTRVKKWFRVFIKRDLPLWVCDDDGDVTHRIWMSASQYAKMLGKAGFKIDYYTFNFIRSNERSLLMKVANKFLSSLFDEFYKMEDNFSFRFKLLSILATSVAFVCRK